MELSPKQQSTELIKKAERILIIGHKEPSGDFLGSALATFEVLKNLGKKVDFVLSDPIPEVYRFLPFLKNIKTQFQHSTGKTLRINTNKVPVKSMQWQKADEFLDIILDTEKNLKFEFIEIINGNPKPDLIIVLNTTDVEKIDKIYDASTEMFFEVPIINIDHHAGNDYFGTVNLVDLTATSSAEILVSLFEALGVKIDNPDIATCLLTGIISETQSFRTQNTTPKSLTVAAQLLAAGARQQEIISNLYKKKPMALLKLWGDMLASISLDKSRSFAWAKVNLSQVAAGISCEDVFDAADELLSNTPEANVILVLCQKENDLINAKVKATKEGNALEIANIFGGDGVAQDAFFEIRGMNLEKAEPYVLKQIHDFWEKKGILANEKNVWDVIAGTNSTNDIKAEKETLIRSEDAIEAALTSLEKDSQKEGFSSIGEVIKKQKPYLKEKRKEKETISESEIDVFDESEEKRISELDI